MGALSMLTSERRKFSRTRCSVSATLRTPNLARRGATAFDICPSGVGVQISGAGSRALVHLLGWSKWFSVSLDLPTGRVRARGRLAWSESVHDGERSGWRIGVQFTRVGPRAREAVRLYLQARSVQSMIDNYADLAAKNLRTVFTG